MASVPNAWGKHSTNQPDQNESPHVPSMREIMDEEVAKELQETENKKLAEHATSEIDASEEKTEDDLPNSSRAFTNLDQFPIDLGLSGTDCSSDWLLAQLLQTEFDKEHDKLLRLEEKKLNGNEKVQVSFLNYRSTRPLDLNGLDSSGNDSDEEYHNVSDDIKELRNLKLDTRRPPDFGSSGVIKKSDGGLVTKHDKTLCGRKNTDRVMEFPPEFQTGDAVKMDMQLPNSVYNKLKTHMINEEKRLHRILDKKDKATSELALDMRTRIVIYKMINSGLLDSVTGTIATGKEAIVLHAKGGTSTEEKIAIPAECALKVYITMLVDFKNRSDYVKEDYRFKNRDKVLKVWAQKELMNLNRMHRVGIRCPSVVKLKKHVLIMSFIGEDGVPAPTLKEVVFDDVDKLKIAFDECVEILKRMYTECKLVHGDFSEFNVLYWHEHCYVIDVAQSMDLSHPKNLIFLARDCYNILKFFVKSGLENTPTDRQLFVDVTGLKQFTSDDHFYTELEEYVNQNFGRSQKRDAYRQTDDMKTNKRANEPVIT